MAREPDLQILGAFPRYWGGQHSVPPEQLRTLLAELARIDDAPSASPDALSAASKVRHIVSVGARHGLPVLVVTD